MKVSNRNSDAELRRQITRKVTRLLDAHNDRNWWLYPASERRAFSQWIFDQIKEAEVRGRKQGYTLVELAEKCGVGKPLGPGLPVSVGSSENRCPQCGGELEGRRCPKCQVTWYI